MARGPDYGYAHRKERARWSRLVDAGRGWCAAPVCLMPTRWIPPGTPWDLDHTPDRTAWLGPSHRKCNRVAGNRSARRRKAARPFITSRRW